MSTVETAPDAREHLQITLQNIDMAQNHLQAAATLLSFSAGSWAGAEGDEKRAKAARIQELLGQLEAVAETVQDIRGF